MSHLHENVLAEKGFEGLNRRWVLSVLFRRQHLILAVFVGIMALVGIKTARHVPQYRAQLKLMVNRDRLDPAVTPDSNTVTQSRGLTEEDVNSEVQLLQSRDLLKKVAQTTAKYQSVPEPAWIDRWVSMIKPSKASVPTDGDEDTVLDGELEVEPIRRSSVIAVFYTCPDPRQAARVLNTLADFYLDKHLDVHRPRGAFEFFQKETERYKDGLASIEVRLSSFGREEGVVSAQAMKASVVQQLGEFEARLKETQAGIMEYEQRVRSYEEQLTATPPRTKTAIHASNSHAIDQLKSSLINLELKRAELLGKYDPTYRLVKDLEDQIVQARESLEKEQNRFSVTTETTDQNPVYQMLTTELAKAKSELPALQARAKAIQKSIQSYRAEAQVLDRKEIMEQDLLRAHKMAQDNYQLYVRKQEEARIANALDRQRIVNVVVTESATVPTHALPSHRGVTLLAGALLAALLGIGLAFGLEFSNPVFNSPNELEAALQVSVLATFPKH